MNKKIILQPEVSVNATNYEIITYNESVVDKCIKVKINLLTEDEQRFDYPEFILWEGDAYDAAGQWTDADANIKIEEILNNQI